ncbi:MAG: TIM barrel protein, partial [Nanoarchaeota archaeon]
PGGNRGQDLMKALREDAEKGVAGQELEFVYGVKMKDETAEEAGKLAKELGLRLSIHAPYYINLLNPDEQKLNNSHRHIMDSCRKGHLLGARSIVFHPGVYGKHDKEDAYAIMKEQIQILLKAINDEGLDVELCPETTGKKSQFGTLDELLRLRRDTGCSLCVDFAHLYARNDGIIDYKEIFDKLEDDGITELHCHFSGIEYSDKGERNHIQMTKEFAQPLMKEALNRSITLMIINESPQPLKGALDMKRWFLD